MVGLLRTNLPHFPAALGGRSALLGAACSDPLFTIVIVHKIEEKVNKNRGFALPKNCRKFYKYLVKLEGRPGNKGCIHSACKL
jgi:hypothetical protein